MSSDLNAIYEGGAFWPVRGQEIAVPEGETVKITIQPSSSASSLDVLSLAAKVYEGMAPDDIADVERIALDRCSFFHGHCGELR